MFKKFRKNEKGFTLAELLIVVAIIGVLVAISIPIFTSQLEKAREATDLANIRSAYAECSAAILTGAGDTTNKVNYNKGDKGAVYNATKDVKLTSTVAGFASEGAKDVAGVDISAIQTVSPASITVEVDSDGTVKIGTATNATTTTP